MDASGTTDPDGDNLSYLWFQYMEAGPFKKPVKINSAENLYKVFLTAPEVEKNGNNSFYIESDRQRYAGANTV